MIDRRNLWRSCGLVYLILTSAVWCQAEASPLSDKIQSLLNPPALSGASVGICAVRADTSEVLYEKNSDLRLVPASNVKVVTSAAALRLLGKDYRCMTRLVVEAGAIRGDILHGNLYIIGSGDPMLTSREIATFAQQITVRGIHQITGSVVGDDSLFHTTRWGRGWNWDDLTWYYAPEISALSLNRNQVDVCLKPTTAGQPASVTLSPQTTYLHVINATRTVAASKSSAGEEDNSIVFLRDNDSRTLRVVGAIPENHVPIIQGCSVPRPALFAAFELTERLRSDGVKVGFSPRTGPGPQGKRQVLSTHESPTLSDIIKFMNKRSDNHAAEQVLCLIGLQSAGTGNAAGGLEGVAEFLNDSGVSESEFRLVDGCGLSRFNLLSPRLLTRVLIKMKDSSEFVESLPVAGVDGTLAGRMKEGELRGNVHAKTGTMTGVSCLSGYLTRRDGVPVVFSIMINSYVADNKAVRDIQDSLCEALYFETK